jgi:hypothetical protein
LLAYLAPDSGVMNVWVRTVGKLDDRPVTHDRTRPIYTYFWQGDSKHVLISRSTRATRTGAVLRRRGGVSGEVSGRQVEPASPGEGVAEFTK